MNIQEPLQLLGGISPETFMRRYWEKKPLLIRQAIPGFKPLLDRGELLDLASMDDVESRLVVQAQKAASKPTATAKGKVKPPKDAGWQFKHGPFKRGSLPPFKQPGWSVLVQGVDLHDERVHALMNQFRFVPDARLDDLMISYATDGGGVGPHFDSYDVFLLQAHGKRRWRIGPQKDKSLLPDMPLKILANFVPEQEFVLEPGDMLYLPPQYAHDGIAEGECMTYSIGFRSPNLGEVARELLERLADDAGDMAGEAIYRDPQQAAVTRSAEMPAAMYDFANKALQAALRDPLAVQRAMGEYLTEPKANVWFGAGEEAIEGNVRLDRRTRMLYDDKHIFINGESFRAGGKDATLIRALADARALSAKDVGRLSEAARALLDEWSAAGWLYGDQ